MSLSRRELFSWLRKPNAAAVPGNPVAEDDESDDDAPAQEAPSFSIEQYYAARPADKSIPAFEIRAAVATPTTRIGGGPVATRDSAGPATEAVTMDPGMVPSVLAHRCLATTSFCSVCVERCPVPGAIVVERGRPRVEPSQCTGCGKCVAVCPAPILAFALVARQNESGL